MSKLLGSLAMVAIALPASASAQLLDSAARPLDGSRRVSLGVTVPLGGASAAEAKPQLELRAAAEPRRNDLRGTFPGAPDWSARHRPEARIGFTLEAQPQLTVAGRALPASDERLGISTLGLVAIGVVTAAVVGGLLFIDAVNDASD